MWTKDGDSYRPRPGQLSERAEEINDKKEAATQTRNGMPPTTSTRESVALKRVAPMTADVQACASMLPYWAGFDDYPGDPKPTPNLWDATYPDEPKSLGREAARVIEEETSPPGTEVDTHVAGTLRNPCVRAGP